MQEEKLTYGLTSNLMIKKNVSLYIFQSDDGFASNVYVVTYF